MIRPLRQVVLTSSSVAFLFVCPAAAESVPPSVLPGVGARFGRTLVDVREAPWRSLGRVQTEIGGRCTGVLVGPNLVLTAAHCLVQWRNHHVLPPSSVHFVLAYAFGQYAAHARAKAFAIAPGYDPSRPDGQPGRDWAVLTLDAAIGSLDDTIPLATNLPASGEAVTLAGYEQDRPEAIQADLRCTVLNVVPDSGGRPVIWHDCNATRGSSGAPLLARAATGGWQVVGVQVVGRYARTPAGPIGTAGGQAVPASVIRLPRQPNPG